MLYVAIVLCAFVAAVTFPRWSSRSLLSIDHPLFWLIALGFVYWALSLSNGNDWVGYFWETDCIRVGQCDEAYVSFEPLFTQLLRLAALTDYQVVPFAAGLAACSAIVLMAKSSLYSGLSILFFVSLSAYYLYVEQVRQGMALCFLLFSVTLYIRNRTWLSILAFLVACLLHWTSVLFVVPFLLGKAGRLTVWLIAGAVASLLTFALLTPEDLLDALVSLGLGEIDLARRLFFYAAIEDYNTAAIGIGFVFDFALMLLLLLPAARVRGERIRLVPIVTAYFVVLLASRANISIYRLSLVFVPFVCVYLGQLLETHPSGVCIGRLCIDKRLYATVIAIVMVAQSSRPLLDPVLQSNLLHHRIYVLNGVPSIDDRYRLADQQCDHLEEHGKGFLCGRW